MEDNKIYTRKQVSEFLGVDPLTVRRYEKEGLIKPAFWIKNRPRYTSNSFEGLENVNTQKNKN